MALSLVSYAARAVAKAVIYRLPNESERCPACDSPRLFDLDMIRFRRSQNVGFVTGCRGCGLVFTNPLPSDADLAQFYSPSGEWGQAHARPAESPAPVRKRRGRGKWLRQFDAIRDDLCVEAPPPGRGYSITAAARDRISTSCRIAAGTRGGSKPPSTTRSRGIGGCMPCQMSRHSIW